MIDARPLLEPLLELHGKIRDSVLSEIGQQQTDDVTRVSREEQGDTIYAIDVRAEEIMLPFFERLSRQSSFVLIGEGLAGGQITFPKGTNESAATWRIIVDPIDGTRGLMYQKRSAWILTGVAPNRGPKTSLQDVILAIQTEIPTLKQHLSDQMWTVKGDGVSAVRHDRLTAQSLPIRLRPSRAMTIAHGFAMVSRFFPGARADLAELDDEVVLGALGPIKVGKAHCFEDQYISTGGQLYELMAGHDRFVADLRPLTEKLLSRRGSPLGLCCHPYDLCSQSIAAELGVILTDPLGRPLNAELNVEQDVAWIGYANEHIRQQVEPLLQAALKKRGWILNQ
jgi:hypothetical protein